MGDTRIDAGYVENPNFDKDDLVLNGQWQTLDLSGILPSNAKRVDMLVIINTVAANGIMEFAERLYDNPVNAAGWNVNYVRTYKDGLNGQDDFTTNLPSDGSRKIVYWGCNWTPFNAVYIVVKGWWV